MDAVASSRRVQEGWDRHAASSSGINDGAAALLVTGDKGKAIARIVTTAVAGVDPSCMGLGPIPATKKATPARRPHDRSDPSGRAE